MSQKIFHHPEPKTGKGSVWPVFLPIAGCPGRCVYCAQERQTGLKTFDLENEFVKLKQGLARRAELKLPPIGLGFFGGTFTALPRKWQERYLGLAGRFKEQGVVDHVRCSTRPDCLSTQSLCRMHADGLDMVELGVQSFSDQVLDRAGRGYTQETVLAGCDLVRTAGLELGIQLLPGLPGHGGREWERDVSETIARAPSVLRIYPCLVITGTVLADWWREGIHHPWSLSETVDRIGPALPRFWEAGIAVIRIGLAPEPELRDGLLAGPWHPALGTLVRARALAEILGARSGGGIGPEDLLRVPRRYSGEFWGHQGSNRDRLAALGFDRNTVRFWDNSWFEVNVPARE
jgi:histone acetyltransferase (RNA polymerase elongator complex component)